MKAVILAGGYGTRISEETHLKPKPMIEIGGKPILWHILKIYSQYGINDFIICCGYKGYVIKEYFANYFLHNANVTFNMRENRMQVHQNMSEDWTVTLVDTGENTMTGGRLKRVQPFLDGQSFCFTYGDGVSDVPIDKLVDFHRAHGKRATLTAIQPPGRFGALDLDAQRIQGFHEKPQGDGSWVNGGFFVLEASVVDLIADDSITFEREPLESLARAGELMAYHHHGFWQCMDSVRDKQFLEELYASGKAPWKRW